MWGVIDVINAKTVTWPSFNCQYHLVLSGNQCQRESVCLRTRGVLQTDNDECCYKQVVVDSPTEC